MVPCVPLRMPLHGFPFVILHAHAMLYYWGLVGDWSFKAIRFIIYLLFTITCLGICIGTIDFLL